MIRISECIFSVLLIVYMTYFYSNLFFFRMYITYQNEPSSNVGFKGTTFHDIIG